MSASALAWAGPCDVQGAGSKARAVLDAVAWYAADHGDPNLAAAHPPVEILPGQAGCWAGVEEIAGRANAGERTVRRVLARLESGGVISRRRRYGRSGSAAPGRVEDLIVLDLVAGPRHVRLPHALSAARSQAGRTGRARQLAPVVGRRQRPLWPAAVDTPAPAIPAPTAAGGETARRRPRKAAASSA